METTTTTTTTTTDITEQAQEALEVATLNVLIRLRRGDLDQFELHDLTIDGLRITTDNGDRAIIWGSSTAGWIMGVLASDQHGHRRFRVDFKS